MYPCNWVNFLFYKFQEKVIRYIYTGLFNLILVILSAYLYGNISFYLYCFLPLGLLTR